MFLHIATMNDLSVHHWEMILFFQDDCCNIWETAWRVWIDSPVSNIFLLECLPLGRDKATKEIFSPNLMLFVSQSFKSIIAIEGQQMGSIWQDMIWLEGDHEYIFQFPGTKTGSCLSRSEKKPVNCRQTTVCNKFSLQFRVRCHRLEAIGILYGDSKVREGKMPSGYSHQRHLGWISWCELIKMLANVHLSRVPWFSAIDTNPALPIASKPKMILQWMFDHSHIWLWLKDRALKFSWLSMQFKVIDLR